jgi:hypothetical protein
LYGIADDFEDDFEGTISDKKAKCIDPWIGAYDSNGEEIGDFSCADEQKDVWASYIYVDRNLTIKGRETWYDDGEYNVAEYDLTFTKGWNIIYGVEKGDNEYFTTTKKPSGVNLKWYFYGYGDWKKSRSDKRNFHHPFSKIK